MGSGSAVRGCDQWTEHRGHQGRELCPELRARGDGEGYERRDETHAS